MLGNINFHEKTIKLDLYLTTYTKINLKWIKTIDTKLKCV